MGLATLGKGWLCPVQSPGMNEQVKCAGDDCAWWSGTMCSVLAIARVLKADRIQGDSRAYIVRTRPEKAVSPAFHNAAFGFWMVRVSRIVQKTVGCSVEDLPDSTFKDWFDSGMSVEEAARQSLEEAGYAREVVMKIGPPRHDPPCTEGRSNE